MYESDNPLLPALRIWLDYKRNKKGLVPRNRLLIALLLLDAILESEQPLIEDDLYTYDYTLKGSRQGAIPRVLTKYKFPLEWGMSREGVTVRGAPGLRVFRAWGGGSILSGMTPAERNAALEQAVEIVRQEVLRVLGQKPVELSAHLFEHTAKFAPALLSAVENRSNGRVEQALVGAKLQLRFPHIPVLASPGFAGDQQTGREADYEVGQMRVVVSVTPKPTHFQSAKQLADAGREVYLIVSDRSLKSAKDRIIRDGYGHSVTVKAVAEFVADNMREIAIHNNVSPQEMCRLLVLEYNRRIAVDRDHSLQVTLPESLNPASSE